MKFCTNCGTGYAEEIKFCQSCGAPFAAQAAPPQQQPMPQQPYAQQPCPMAPAQPFAPAAEAKRNDLCRTHFRH